MVDANYKEQFEEIARRANVSGAVLLELVIEQLGEELGPKGIPTWWHTSPIPNAQSPADCASLPSAAADSRTMTTTERCVPAGASEMRS
ncbi:hypothetical protein [Microbacterium sp. RU33B]|uniref:hypothetical protein n=1 Tax=Microbacterium sp. RU33B TaxID=1907390 RepID=UPI00095D7D66|nr:hypothetical protein [Microbacterium sp. RU33B]SIT72541.1 hypothetical protein SAMN05880545_1070 [Microbacterium sp. RU33B]